MTLDFSLALFGMDIREYPSQTLWNQRDVALWISLEDKLAQRLGHSMNILSPKLRVEISFIYLAWNSSETNWTRVPGPRGDAQLCRPACRLTWSSIWQRSPFCPEWSCCPARSGRRGSARMTPPWSETRVSERLKSVADDDIFGLNYLFSYWGRFSWTAKLKSIFTV